MASNNSEGDTAPSSQEAVSANESEQAATRGPALDPSFTTSVAEAIRSSLESLIASNPIGRRTSPVPASGPATNTLGGASPENNTGARLEQVGRHITNRHERRAARQEALERRMREGEILSQRYEEALARNNEAIARNEEAIARAEDQLRARRHQLRIARYQAERSRRVCVSDAERLRAEEDAEDMEELYGRKRYEVSYEGRLELFR